MNAQSYAESEATEKLAQEWRDRGFQVFVEPRDFEGLEDIFRYYKPDIIAIKNDEKLIIEVKSKGAVGRPLVEAQLKQVREILKDYPEWKFQVVYYGEEHGDLPILSQKKLLTHINQVENIITIDPTLALIKLWSLTEALVRHLYPELTK